MKENIVTIAVVLAMVVGLAMFNVYFHQEPTPPEQVEAAEQAAEEIEKGEALAKELEAEAAEIAANAPSKPEPEPVNPDWPAEMPDVYQLKFETSKGDFVMEVHKEWAPLAAQRMWELAREGFFDDMRFFRVVKTPRPFMAQFGLAADPALNTKWGGKNMQDEPVKQSNKRGFVSFAMGGKNTRSTQMFINYADNSYLDNYNNIGFPPFAQVIEGMETVDKFNGQYGERTTQKQGEIASQGNAYLDQNFPGLDHIKSVTLIQEEEETESAPPAN